MAVGSLFVWCRPDIAWSSVFSGGPRQMSCEAGARAMSTDSRGVNPPFCEADADTGSHAADRFQADPTRNAVNLLSRSGKNSGKEQTFRDLETVFLQ